MRDVRPDHRFHAAFEGVKNCEGDDEDDRDGFGGSENHADDQRDRGDAYAFGDGSGDQKCAGGNFTHLRAEALFDQGVGGEIFAAKISRQQK